MPLVTNRAANAVNKIVSRRFSYQKISDWVEANFGIKADRTHIYRIGTTERDATKELEQALIAAARKMK